MYISFLRPLLLAVLVVVGFLMVHVLLQQERIYSRTLGRIAQNYERIGTWDHSEVVRTDRPFMTVTSDSLCNWDAGIYACIKEHLYTAGTACYGTVRAAFFPLMPLVWRASGTSAIGMGLLNYAFFAIGLALLVRLFHEGISTVAIGVLLTFPSAIIFGIPYSESLFMLTMALVAWGMVKERYAVYFIGALLLAMVRPATLFVLIAVVLSEVLVNRPQGLIATLIAIVRRSIPFMVGYGIVMVIQYATSGSWHAMIDAQAHWQSGLRPLASIKDWSQESFGLSSFAVFFVCLPAMVFSFLHLWRSMFATDGGRTVQRRTQLLVISCFYLTGILLFTLLTSGGDLHGFHRFTLASPFFYVAALILLRHRSTSERSRVLGPALVASLSMLVFLSGTEYGGDRFQFPFAGMFLAMAASFFLLGQQCLRPFVRGVVGIVLILANLVWAAYLLNCLVVDGWLFT